MERKNVALCVAVGVLLIGLAFLSAVASRTPPPQNLCLNKPLYHGAFDRSLPNIASPGWSPPTNKYNYTEFTRLWYASNKPPVFYGTFYEEAYLYFNDGIGISLYDCGVNKT